MEKTKSSALSATATGLKKLNPVKLEITKSPDDGPKIK
jgi:hypothetical protein